MLRIIPSRLGGLLWLLPLLCSPQPSLAAETEWSDRVVHLTEPRMATADEQLSTCPTATLHLVPLLLRGINTCSHVTTQRRCVNRATSKSLDFKASGASSDQSRGMVEQKPQSLDEAIELLKKWNLEGLSDQQKKTLESEVTCKDNDGKLVDWFIAIKMSNSRKFVFATDKTTDRTVHGDNVKWIEGQDITTASPVQKTLQQAFNKSPQSVLLAYNDHPPGENASLTGGHMKGVIMYGTAEDNYLGFWMIHSVPQFPDFRSEQPTWPRRIEENGQSFFCATVTIMDLTNIINNIRVAQPNYFEFPDRLVPGANRRMNQIYTCNMQTHGQQNLHLKLKTEDNYEDIYSNSIMNGHTLIRMYVQSYRLGTSLPLPSNGSVENVASTKFKNGLMRFTRDNSKWSIGIERGTAENRNLKFVCIGDLDRVEAHKMRGGGLLCFESEPVWQLFWDAVHSEAPEQQQQLTEPQIQDGSFPCMIDGNEPVDWFILMKERNSVKYRYISSRNSADWNPNSNNDITNNSGPLFETLRQTNADRPTVLAYSDQPPGTGNAQRTHAHAKGVVMYGNKTGFWLMHSMPRFPNMSMEANILWPENEGEPNKVKAQIFVCFTFKAAEADKIRNQIERMNPFFYYPENINLDRTTFGLPFRSIRLESQGGVEFLHISKPPDYGMDAYKIVSDLVGEELLVQTYLGGKVKWLESSAGSAINIIQTEYWHDFEASPTTDHSKWCVTKSNARSNRNFFCIGDLNRASTQLSRGGGLLCFWNRNVWQKFWEAIVEYVVHVE